MPGLTMNSPDAAHPAPHDPTTTGDLDMESSHDLEDLNLKPKKKRRVIKISDKKYECSEPQCGKSYSRAEHLYRHQLNHQPKQIYHCDFPDCDRSFVRADLCTRHKERHTAKGSHLQRKDAFMNSQRSAATAAPAVDMPDSTPAALHIISPTDSTRSIINPPRNPADVYLPPRTTTQPYAPNQDRYPGPGLAAEPGAAPPSVGLHVQPPAGPAYAAPPYPPNGYTAAAPPAVTQPPSPKGSAQRISYDPPVNGYERASQGAPNSYNRPLTVGQMHPPPPTANGPSSPHSTNTSMYMQQNDHFPSPMSNPANFRSPTSYPNMSTLPPYGVPPQTAYAVATNPGSGNTLSSPTITSLQAYQAAHPQANGMMDFNLMEQQYAAGYAMPVFGNDGFNRSPPSAIDLQFFTQLIDVGGYEVNVPSPPAPEPIFPAPQMTVTTAPKQESAETKVDSESTPAQEPWDSSSPTISEMDLDLRESQVTDQKQNRIIELLHSFEEIAETPGRKLKTDILSGDMSDPQHTLSVNMLKTYLTSYWIHIHQQMPILHRPTFNAETCPDLLLLAMMCLGACCLERSQSSEQIHHCAEMAYFAAYHIRWEVFKDAEFRPTAKLWTFQTMLLLELFEKMYSTRALHERAHIHHATTLTVMRRGSSLIGRSAIDALSGSSNDPTRTPPGPDGSINTSGQNTADAWWNRWITAEATRRVAFAAFVIDSTHATLFGHSAVMSPHDIRLPLPCDEALWSATSSAEVQRVEASLAANGFKPLTFLEGLKKTLNGQKVRTNTFGRVVLMAGLLNVSWHMNQRDLQVSSLGAAVTLGGPHRWRSPLTRAFDFWRRDFDDSLSKNDHWLQVCNPNAKDRNSIHQRDSVFESRTCLHSLAHMAMHVDIIDCEVFAGSERMLGRTVTEADRTAVQRRMCEQWAPSARARDATFYALRFLCEVLIPREDLNASKSGQPNFSYSARDDYLLNRPWILYFASMIVWSYGYALDGALPSSAYNLTTRESQIADMQRFLIRVGGVPSPEDLEKLEDRNSCLGMLILLRECFRLPRWELLHEASDMIGLCIDLLMPANRDAKAARNETMEQ